MWAAFVRQFAAYAITRRGKKLFALIGVLALCFGAALLIDMSPTACRWRFGAKPFISSPKVLFPSPMPTRPSPMVPACAGR